MLIKQQQNTNFATLFSLFYQWKITVRRSFRAAFYMFWERQTQLGTKTDLTQQSIESQLNGNFELTLPNFWVKSANIVELSQKKFWVNSIKILS